MGVAEKEAKKPFMGKNPHFELGMKVSLWLKGAGNITVSAEK